MTALEPNTRLFTLFLSCPGDVLAEKAMMVRVAQELNPSFLRHGIVLEAWTFETGAVPAMAPKNGSVQTVIDRRIPRNRDGSVAYDLFIGIMDRRIGTPLEDAPSGTVHEFLEAKRSFELSRRPHILFYFRQRDREENPDPQVQGVREFRSQYPGLFANYSSVEDLEAQFRRHLLTELLDFFHPKDPLDDGDQACMGWDRLAEEYEKTGRPTKVPFFDRSPARILRIVRKLHLLFDIEHRLSGSERHILSAALFALQLDGAGRDRFIETAGQVSGTALAIRDVVSRVSDSSKLTSPQGGGAGRLDLLGALAATGLRLDLTKNSIMPGAHAETPANADELLASLTSDVECERGIVRYHLLAPSELWVRPLIGATAIAMEALWQRVRRVLTKYGFSFAVARSRVELEYDSEPLSQSELELLEQTAKEASASLPACPHFGKLTLPPIEWLLPLPTSVVIGAVQFAAPMSGPIRLLANGQCVSEAGEGTIEYLPSSGDFVEYILECDEAGEYVAVLSSGLRRIGPAEMVVLECSPDRPGAMRSLGLWNEILKGVWPDVVCPEPNQEALSTAFHVLRNAFLELSSATGALLTRRDLYWDAMEVVRRRLTSPLKPE